MNRTVTLPHLETDDPSRNFLQLIYDTDGKNPVVVRVGRELNFWARSEAAVALDRKRCQELAEALLIACALMRAAEITNLDGPLLVLP